MRVHVMRTSKAYASIAHSLTSDKVSSALPAQYAAAQHDCMVTGLAVCHLVVMEGPQSADSAEDRLPKSVQLTIHADVEWQHRWR